MANALRSAPRSLVATVAGICTPAQRDETAGVLASLRARSAVRTILMTLGDEPQPDMRQDGDATIIEGLVPGYVNNAVAALRLSSLPTVVWWRGSLSARPEALAAVATLVDRLVLDTADPARDWPAAVPLLERTALGDLRWTRLTRWRSLTAQFFDMPEVRARLTSYRRLALEGGDEPALRLFAAWLQTRLPQGRELAVSCSGGASGPPVRGVALSGDGGTLALRLLPSLNCIQTSVEQPGAASISRVVSLDEPSLDQLLGEELRVRARDEAFEQALRRVVTR